MDSIKEHKDWYRRFKDIEPSKNEDLWENNLDPCGGKFNTMGCPMMFYAIPSNQRSVECPQCGKTIMNSAPVFSM